MTVAVICGSLSRLNHYGSDPRLENQSLYDLSDDKLVLASRHARNSDATISLLLYKSSDEETIDNFGREKLLLVKVI